jgi:hypothetical protein
MTEGALFAVLRFMISATLAGGGVACIIYGYKLFASGAGLAKGADKFDFKSRQVKISAAGMSVGGILLLTSTAWGYFAYSSVPKLRLAGTNLEITYAPSGGPLAAVDIRKNKSDAAGDLPVIGVPVLAKGRNGENRKIGEITNWIVGSEGASTGLVVKYVPGRSTEKETFVICDPETLDFVKTDQGVAAVLKKEPGATFQDVASQHQTTFPAPAAWAN